MTLSWPTFILEIVNFLVLVWILKRFLYQPILQAIEERKARRRQSWARRERAIAPAGIAKPAATGLTC